MRIERGLSLFFYGLKVHLFLFESHSIDSLEQIDYPNNTEFDKMRWYFFSC